MHGRRCFHGSLRGRSSRSASANRPAYCQYACLCLRRRLEASHGRWCWSIAHRGSEVTSSELRKHLQAHVPDYMIPAGFVRLDSLPLTANGKVDRAALPEPDAFNTLRAEISAQARTGTEEKLVAMLCGLLGIEHVNASDNFFLLGGHSLLGAQLLTQI